MTGTHMDVELRDTIDGIAREWLNDADAFPSLGSEELPRGLRILIAVVLERCARQVLVAIDASQKGYV